MPTTDSSRRDSSDMTRSINISRARFSNLAWEVILENAVKHQHRRSTLARIGLDCEHLRSKADYNTGSISNSAMWCIASAALFFEPKVVAEVGTFIGKTTKSVAWAMQSYGGTDIYTCDASNDIELPKSFGVSITQFPRKPSINMFHYMMNTGMKADMLLLDGRLSPEDIEVLESVTHDNTVILLDDFEGNEKGVANAVHVMTRMKPITHKLVYPPTAPLLEKHGLVETCSIAMIVPNTLIGWTNQ